MDINLRKHWSDSIRDLATKALEAIEGSKPAVDSRTYQRLCRAHLQDQPRGAGTHRIHSARTDEPYFIGSYEMYQFVARIAEQEGLEYKLSYRGATTDQRL